MTRVTTNGTSADRHGGLFANAQGARYTITGDIHVTRASGGSRAEGTPSPAPRSTGSTWSPEMTPRTDTGSEVSWAEVLSAPPTPERRVRSGGSTPSARPSGSSSNQRAGAGNPDEPIPSTESPGTPTSSGSGARGANTPSISLSPPPSVRPRSPSTPLPAVRSRDQSSVAITRDMGGLHLGETETPLGMSSVVVAIDNVANGTDTAVADNLEDLAAPSPMPRRSASPGPAPVHDVRDEELPEHRFHSGDVQHALADAKETMGCLAGVLGSSALHADPASTVHRCKQEAEKLASFEVKATRMVGFVGESGVGKSSLLNSLLDYEDLARTSNSGGACTCVATEYHYHDRDDFVIDVELFSLEEMKEQITDLLQAYRNFHINPEESSEPREEMKKKAEVADCTFQTIFHARRPTREFLCGPSFHAIVGDLHKWTQDVYPEGMDGRVAQVPTREECSDELMRLTSQAVTAEGAAEQAVAWPFIERVKVSLNAHILSNGLVLVDLPGLRDVNAARVAVTERHLQKCAEIFAVSKIGRATTDAGILSVFELARRANLSNVGIVCTSSDDIEAREAKRDWTGRKGQDVQRLCEDVSGLRQQLQQIEDELEESEDADAVTLHTLHRRRRGVRTRTKQAELALKSFLVETRNNMITGRLERALRGLVPGGAVRVFCVSNKIYLDWRKKPREQALNWLNLSGIISLRRHCLALTTDSQMESLTKYITTDIPAVLGNVDLWIQAGAESADAEQKRVVREALDELEARLKEALKGEESDLTNIWELTTSAFNEEISQACATFKWTREAIAASNDWRQMHHSSYAAFCRNLGDYNTKAAGCRNWNQEAVNGMAEDVAELWNDFFSELRLIRDTIVALLKSSLSTSNMQLGAAVTNGAQLEALQRSVRARRRQAVVEFGNLWHQFELDLAALHTHAFTGIHSSMIVEALRPAYRNCNLESGAGSDARRKSIMHSAVSDPRLFEDLMRKVNVRFEELSMALDEAMDEAVDVLLGEICRAMDFIRMDNAAVEGEQDPAFRERVQIQALEANEEMARLQGVIRG